MNRNDEDFENDRFSMGVSLLIALCIVGIFCALSIALIENLQVRGNLSAAKHVVLPNSKDIAGLVI